MNVSRNVVLTKAHLAHVVRHFMGEGGFSMDCETVGEYRGTPALNTVTWMGLATNGMAVAIPFAHPIGSRVTGETKEPRADKNGKIRMFRVPVYDAPPEQLPIGSVTEALRPLFFSDRTKVFHEATFDLGSVTKYFGEIPPGPYEDTKLIEWLLNENRPQQGLKYHTNRLFGVDYDKENVGKKVEIHPFNTVARYQYMDALYTWLIYKRDRPRIDKLGLTHVYKDIEAALIYDLTDMRLAGVPVDVPRLEAMRDDLGERLIEIEGQVYKAAGMEFNLNSPQQKAKILFDPKTEGGQGLKPWKKTDGGGWSTDADALESYPDNELCQALLEYQTTHKLLSGYVNAYLGVDGDAKKPRLISNNRIYAEPQQHGTRTGRFSYRAPNLQNVGRPDTDDGKLIRGAFIAPPGGKLIVADYGQIELVILAHYLGKGALFDGFIQGIDPHQMTAAMVLGKDPAAVTKDERQRYGKSLNFAVTYGAGPAKVAQMAGVSLKGAKEILAKHGEAFPEINAFRRKVVAEAKTRKPPHVRTIGGRVRRCPELWSADDGLRMYSERQLFNALLQGGSADLTKMAIIRANKSFREKLPGTETRVLLTVHDELMVSAPEAHAPAARDLLVEAMIGKEMQALLRVPMAVDAKIVKRWSEAK